MGVSVEEFENAMGSLRESLDLHSSATDAGFKKAFRDASIQRFKYCLELSWKLSMKKLGSQTVASKQAVREMARSNLIDDPNRWIDFVDARNNTSHSYDENVATKVFSEIEAFLPQAQLLLGRLKKLL